MTGIICVNKDKDITSFGVVAKVRGITRERKAGHTGTLDPMATGVLPVMLGGATRFLNYLPDSDKGYRAVFELGKTTDTLDITGKIISTCDVSCNTDDVKKAMQKFVGVIEQVPPMYSAKSVDGVRLYDLARQGKEIEREACRVEIKSLELMDFDESRNTYTIDVLCSKGTYIRSLIDDIGKELGCGAVMTELTRTSAMGFDISDCVTIDELQVLKDNDEGFDGVLMPLEKIFECYKRVNVTSAQGKRFFNGGALDIKRIRTQIDDNEICTVYSEEKFLGLGQHIENELKVLRVLAKRDQMNNIIDDNERIAVALGDFDGMHLAHRTVTTGAKNVIIYCVNNHFSLLQKSIFERRFPNAVFADFEEIKNQSGEEFINNTLIGRFNAGMILCGFNFKFGKNASWSAVDLRNHLEKQGIWVRILEHLDYDGMPISSTRIRKAVAQGDIKGANQMLGYNFTFESEVISGDKRGRTIGFPTINQHLPEGLIVPKYGVYESRAFIEDKEYKAFTNIGIRPSWRVDKPLCETHIFDFSGDLYGKVVRIELIDYKRAEKTFSSVEELKEQLDYDKSSIV